MLTIAETDVFTKQANALFTEAELDDLKLLLAVNPEEGDVIKGTGGLKKAAVESTAKGQARWRTRDLLLPQQNNPRSASSGLQQDRARRLNAPSTAGIKRTCRTIKDRGSPWTMNYSIN